jgi:hypothetical protein
MAVKPKKKCCKSKKHCRRCPKRFGKRRKS